MLTVRAQIRTGQAAVNKKSLNPIAILIAPRHAAPKELIAVRAIRHGQGMLRLIALRHGTKTHAKNGRAIPVEMILRHRLHAGAGWNSNHGFLTSGH